MDEDRVIFNKINRLRFTQRFSHLSKKLSKKNNLVSNIDKIFISGYVFIN